MKQRAFDEMFPVQRLPERARVNEARDEAMREVAQHADERRADFASDAEAFIMGYLERNGPTSGELLTVECKLAGIAPHDDRAFGPVYFRLARRGMIEKVGTVRRERGHGTAGGNVWALAENRR